MKNVAIAIGLWSAVFAHAGPFGLSQGMSLEAVKKHGAFVPFSGQAYTYHGVGLKSGHPDFRSYYLTVTPTHGLCSIVAVGEKIPSNGQGIELRNKFYDILEALIKKYGNNGELDDDLKVGSKLTDANQWMEALAAEQRRLVARWFKPEVKLPDSIDSVFLRALANVSDGGSIALTYNFDNSRECTRWIKADKNSVL